MSDSPPPPRILSLVDLCKEHHNLRVLAKVNYEHSLQCETKIQSMNKLVTDLCVREQTANAVLLQTTEQLKNTWQQLAWATQEIEKLKAASALLEHSQNPVQYRSARRKKRHYTQDFPTIPEEEAFDGLEKLEQLEQLIAPDEF